MDACERAANGNDGAFFAVYRRIYIVYRQYKWYQLQWMKFHILQVAPFNGRMVSSFVGIQPVTMWTIISKCIHLLRPHQIKYLKNSRNILNFLIQYEQLCNLSLESWLKAVSQPLEQCEKSWLSKNRRWAITIAAHYVIQIFFPLSKTIKISSQTKEN